MSAKFYEGINHIFTNRDGASNPNIYLKAGQGETLNINAAITGGDIICDTITIQSTATNCLLAAGGMTVAGIATFANTTPTTSSADGSVVIKGGLGVAKGISASGNITTSTLVQADQYLRVAGSTDTTRLISAGNAQTDSSFSCAMRIKSDVGSPWSGGLACGSLSGDATIQGNLGGVATYAAHNSSLNAYRAVVFGNAAATTSLTGSNVSVTASQAITVSAGTTLNLNGTTITVLNSFTGNGLANFNQPYMLIKGLASAQTITAGTLTTLNVTTFDGTPTYTGVNNPTIANGVVTINATGYYSINYGVLIDTALVGGNQHVYSFISINGDTSASSLVCPGECSKFTSDDMSIVNGSGIILLSATDTVEIVLFSQQDVRTGLTGSVYSGLFYSYFNVAKVF